MTFPAFLTGAEVALMKQDFSALLNSPEATDLTFVYASGVGAATPDTVFGLTDYANEEQEVSFTGRGIQQIVGPREESILKWGILEEGDAIFFVSTSQNLDVGIDGSLEIVGPNGVRWSPVPRNLKAFYNYLLTRLGNSQLAQVIPCRLKR